MAKLPSLSHPKLLYFSRLLQLILAIAFLILICYCGTHRAWWTNINGPLAVGVIASIATLALALYTVVRSHFNRNPFTTPSLLRLLLLLSLEILAFLLWIASVTLILRPKHGCDKDANQRGKWQEWMWDGKKGGDDDDEGKWKKDGKERDVCFPHGVPKEGATTDLGPHFWPGDVPAWEWNLAAALGVVSAVSFLLTAVLVWREERGRKGSGGGGPVAGHGGGGTSYA